jgi:hypothetical protein
MRPSHAQTFASFVSVDSGGLKGLSYRRKGPPSLLSMSWRCLVSGPHSGKYTMSTSAPPPHVEIMTPIQEDQRDLSLDRSKIHGFSHRLCSSPAYVLQKISPAHDGFRSNLPSDRSVKDMTIYGLGLGQCLYRARAVFREHDPTTRSID